MFFSSGVFLVWAFCSSLAVLPVPLGALEVDNLMTGVFADSMVDDKELQ